MDYIIGKHMHRRRDDKYGILSWENSHNMLTERSSSNKQNESEKSAFGMFLWFENSPPPYLDIIDQP